MSNSSRLSSLWKTEKAAGTIHELRHVLDHDPVISPEDRHMQHLIQSESKETLTSGTEHSDYSYSAAVSRLRDMLHRVTSVEPPPSTPKTVIFAPPQRVRIGCRNSTHKYIFIWHLL